MLDILLKIVLTAMAIIDVAIFISLFLYWRSIKRDETSKDHNHEREHEQEKKQDECNHG